MKIYEPYNKELFRLKITKKGESTEYITICEATRTEILEFIYKNLKDKIKFSPFAKGYKTSINIRQYFGNHPAKHDTISFICEEKTEDILQIIKDSLL